MRKRRYQILAGVCAVALLCSGCRKRVVTGPEEQMSERYHEEVPSMKTNLTEPSQSDESEDEGEEKKKSSGPSQYTRDSKSDSSQENNSGEHLSENRNVTNHDSSEKSEKKQKKTDKKTDRTSSEENSENKPKEKLKEKSREQSTPDRPADNPTDDLEKNREDKTAEPPEDNSKERGDTPKETPSSEQSPDGVDKEFGIIIDKYKKDFMNQMTIYPCQFLRVYYETKEDYVTVNASSEEQRLIQDAAAENVGTDLGKDYLTVDFSWVEKKNPEYIIKCVDASVLGEKVADTDGAKEQWQQISERENWDSLSAVQGGNILLLSEELLKTEQGKLMLKYYVANALHPELFSEMKLDEIKEELLGENGIYCYEG